MLITLVYAHFAVAGIVAALIYFLILRKHFKKIICSDIPILIGISISWEWWVIKFGYEFLMQEKE